MRATQRALLNILEDSESDTTRMHATQRAVLNILEDSESDTIQMHATQRAVLNILEDSESDKSQMRATQRAVINILEDFDSERVERMRADELVRALNRDLEARVVQRTAALTAANQELESFAYSVAHDLRAPLRAIDGFSLIIHEENSDVLSEDGKDALRRVRAASQRMGALIDDMLKLAHSTRGVIDVAVVDLSAIAEAVAQSLVSSSPTRDVRVSIARSVIGLGDGVLLRTVLENLLANAWKFTAKTPAAVIEFGSQERGGELICYVRDNGAGFDMAYEHNLFLPFQRLHRPSDFPGNGIGLATVKRIVARLGGRVWAVGAVNEGATFYFSLPRVTAARGKELP
jgi:light-regulated signal transduction histidine kinase (bacteriophytochrome)